MSLSTRWESARDHVRDRGPTPALGVKSLEIIEKALQITLEEDF
jgi:hypothetical protein